jgi:outer membrane protein assembly factor BamA
MCRIFLVASLYALSAWSILPHAAAQEREEQPPVQGERIVTEVEVNRAEHPAASVPLRFVFYPFHLVNSGMESGLVSFERHNMRERLDYYTEYLRQRGVAVLIGGLGEGTGIGLGGSYTMKTGGGSDLRFLGRASFMRAYEELDVRWTNPVGKARFVLEGSYQWRPQENFYGFGMDSHLSDHAKFALRQTWTGVRGEVAPHRRLRFGGEYKLAWLYSMDSPNTQYGSPEAVFPGLPGFRQNVHLQSLGFYADADGLNGEYEMGGLLHAGASLQDGLGENALQYFSYEGQAEGRLPIAKERSALVFQGSLEFTRPRSGSVAIPFYLYPHIGGESTLRGYNLDRFYGQNIFLVALEYRYRIHPDFQALIFFDEGQVFGRTSDLSWLNWQRNYGFGFKIMSSGSTIMRMDFGWSSEGYTYHISWGDRVHGALGGPIRYGTYRR